MQIQMNSSGFHLTQALRDHAERRLGFALAAARGRVQRVVLSLSDLNGPRGGVDKKCRIRVVLDGAGAVLVEDIQADAYVAIDRAAGRVGRSLSRLLERARRRGRWLSGLRPRAFVA